MVVNFRRISAALMVVALTGFVSPAFSAEAEKKDDNKVAVVNGTVISKASFDRAMTPIEQRMAQGQKPDESQLLEMKKNVLENLINMELLYQESKKSGVKIDDKAIDEKLAELKKGFPDDAQFNAALKNMNFTEDSLKDQLKEGLSIQEFVDNQFSKSITLSDKEVKDYYDSNSDAFKHPEQVKASHILIKVDPKADDAKKAEARKKLEAIQEKLKKGEDFATLAKDSSECPSSAKGGDLGYFGRGQMVKPFEDTAFALKPGETSDIVETRFGYHLVKLIDKKPEGMTPYEEVKPKLEKYLKDEKVQNELKLYVEKIKEKSKIERFIK